MIKDGSPKPNVEIIQAQSASSGLLGVYSNGGVTLGTCSHIGDGRLLIPAHLLALRSPTDQIQAVFGSTKFDNVKVIQEADGIDLALLQCDDLPSNTPLVISTNYPSLEENDYVFACRNVPNNLIIPGNVISYSALRAAGFNERVIRRNFKEHSVENIVPVMTDMHGGFPIAVSGMQIFSTEGNFVGMLTMVTESATSLFYFLTSKEIHKQLNKF